MGELKLQDLIKLLKNLPAYFWLVLLVFLVSSSKNSIHSTIGWLAWAAVLWSSMLLMETLQYFVVKEKLNRIEQKLEDLEV